MKVIEMNKIIVDTKEIVLENEDVILDGFLEENLSLNIIGNVNCGVVNIKNNLNITIYLHENAILNLEFFVDLKDIINQITVYNKDNSKLNLKYACTYEGENKLVICNHVASNNTETNILVRAVEENGNILIKAEGCIYENTKSNVYLEDIKALTKNNHSVKIMPNLLVKTNSVIANHNATISNIQNPELFYLESKGISKDKAVELIKSGFLKGILNIEDIKVGGEIIDE